MRLGCDLHGDGRAIREGEIVAPWERLSWPRTIGFGAQHVVAMFGATFLVPLLTGFPPTTTLFFSGIGTLLFLLVTATGCPATSAPRSPSSRRSPRRPAPSTPAWAARSSG